MEMDSRSIPTGLNLFTGNSCALDGDGLNFSLVSGQFDWQ